MGKVSLRQIQDTMRYIQDTFNNTLNSIAYTGVYLTSKNTLFGMSDAPDL